MSRVAKIRVAIRLRRALALVLMLFCCAALTAQQDDPGPDSTRRRRAVDSAASDTEVEALSADRIIQTLRQHPELLDRVKAAASRTMQDDGRAFSATEITDEALFSRIEEDSSFRAQLTRQLREQGLSAPSDFDSLETSRLERTSPAPGRKKTNQRPAGNELEPPGDQNQPLTTEKPNPYPGMQALEDLYRQIPSQSGPLQRFGADIFRNGTGNLEGLPMDLPAGSDYVLGPGDGLNINMWGSVSQRLARTVDREGKVSLPEAGDVVVAGQTVADAQRNVERVLRGQFRGVNVDLSLARLRSIRVYVVGDVARPGAYDISSLSTPLNALYAAGGPTARGSLRTVRHYRGNRLVREVDLYELLLRGVRSDVARLEPGDTILVPPVGPQVTVVGMVRRPATYELKGPTELADVLDVAGGVLVSATLRQINVERIEAHQRRVTLSVQLPAPNEKQSLDRAIAGFQVQDGDRVTISPILPYSDETVYLQGHVFRPGKYPYHPGIQISELIRSYQDLLPEPADHAEIVRLVPPDHHPEVIEFKLSEVVSGDDPIDLQPFDTIRIFGRYEIDPPKVFIYGEVLRPGKYPLASGMRASDLVHLAGGFKRSAYTQTADITSYVVQHDDRVVTRHKTVEIAKALAGDHDVDALLKPGDVLTVRQLSGWRDIGAAVELSGEVLFPGTYGIEDGEKLSTLLRQAGGFRAEAYPEGAVLERVQVRELEEKSRRELVRRIEIEGGNTRISASETGADRAALLQTMNEQKEHVLTALRTQPATGRLVIRISGDINHWQNTAADIELRAGDVLIIPKRPSFVLISGQVYSPSAITYTPGKNAGWYLQQAGGPTDLANRKDIYVIRANGGVVGQGNGSGLWRGNVLSAVLRPGDTLVVPEKIITGSSGWKNALTTAQLVSSMAIAAAAVHSF